jgi:hypothetical protein
MQEVEDVCNGWEQEVLRLSRRVRLLSLFQ